MDIEGIAKCPTLIQPFNRRGRCEPVAHLRQVGSREAAVQLRVASDLLPDCLSQVSESVEGAPGKCICDLRGNRGRHTCVKPIAPDRGQVTADSCYAERVSQRRREHELGIAKYKKARLGRASWLMAIYWFNGLPPEARETMLTPFSSIFFLTSAWILSSRIESARFVSVLNMAYRGSSPVLSGFTCTKAHAGAEPSHRCL